MAQLIDKSALVAEINRVLNSYDPNEITSGRYALVDLRNFIDTLEVKEVDYERELSKYVSNGIHRFFPNVDDDYCKIDSVIWQDYVIETAKYFFELGLKAQKGE